jgi:DNA-binding NtrC family response regulator
MAGQLWAVTTLGGYFYSRRLSQKLREAVQPMTKLRQFCDVKDANAQGQKKGDIFTWDVVMNMATQGTTLVETNVMPETNFTIAQATGTVYEYGNSVKLGAASFLAKFVNNLRAIVVSGPMACCA